MHFFVATIFHSKHFICCVFHCCPLRCSSCGAVESASEQKVSFKRFPLLKRSVLPGVKKPPRLQEKKSFIVTWKNNYIYVYIFIYNM